MSLTGYLSEYSLIEIFNFVQEGNKTGLLSIDPDRCLTRSIDNSYQISFQSGRIMSVINGHKLEERGLLKMMLQRQWLCSEQVSMLSAQIDKLGQPLGTYLKSCNQIDTDRLHLLFDTQVVASICKLFQENHYGRFHFDDRAALSYEEMTGISLPAREVALMGLRMLRDWSGLIVKLPAPESALQRLSSTPPNLRLDTQESKVWNLSLGAQSIAQIAAQLGLKIEKVQQIGFRLSAIGLVSEVLPPKIATTIDIPNSNSGDPNTTSTPISTSFLSKLRGFLKKKV